MLEWREHFVARHETEVKLDEIAHVIPDNHQGAVCDDKPQEQ